MSDEVLFLWFQFDHTLLLRREEIWGWSEVVVVLEPGDGAVDTLLKVSAGFETGGGGESGGVRQ